MDEVIFVVLLVAVLVLVLPIMSFIGARRANARIAQLEARLEKLEQQGNASPAPSAPLSQTPNQLIASVLPKVQPAAAASLDPSARPLSPAENIPGVRGLAPAAPPSPAPTSGWTAAIGPWLRENWIYPAAAAFLMLAGVFLVQYSIEMGLLSARLRIGMALVLGAALVVGAEIIRRRANLSDMFGSFSAHLPSTFAGSGVVVLYGAIFAAHVLYDLIGAAPAFILMGVVTLLAIGLGWVYGPLLAALGVLAGSITPLLLGQGGVPPAWIFGYFGIILVLGLGIDSFRRWYWVSALALIAPLAAATLMRLAGGDALAYVLLLVWAAILALSLPFGALRPNASGPGLLVAGARAAKPVWLSAGAIAAASALIVGLVPDASGAAGLVVLALAITVWAKNAPALADQVVFPSVGLLAWAILQALQNGPAFTFFIKDLPPESKMPIEASLLVLGALIVGLAMVWRSDKEGAVPSQYWAVAGVVLPGAMLVALELFWKPGAVIGAYPWALHAMALAALNTLQSLNFARLDRGQGLRLGSAAASAFALIALGMMLIFSLAALTLALAVLMVASAVMDRRFNLPALGVFQILASMALAYRFVVDPGLFWIFEDIASLSEVILTLAAVLGGPAVTLWLLRDLPNDGLRQKARLFVETGLSGMVAVAVPVVLVRVLQLDLGLHAMFGLHATVFTALAWVQKKRSERFENAKVLRLALAAVYGVIAAFLITLSVFVFSPLSPDWFSNGVQGVALVNDLLPAYAFPAIAVLVLFAGNRLFRAIGVALTIFWAALVIRHFWQGSAGMGMENGMLQPELYTYTVAILLGGAAALVRALQSGQAKWRKIGMGLIALATLKAFLVDASGLEGLLRVFGFLAMGLALAGLAWVNRWVMTKERGALTEYPAPSP